ncbi:hypothetical protein BJV78DRAFT_1158013 [Lactifluus subvellereus]|nr:hypothetical protein BJV78DRAFT_1158013 [Lactifluus subvellereus]
MHQIISDLPVRVQCKGVMYLYTVEALGPTLPLLHLVLGEGCAEALSLEVGSLCDPGVVVAAPASDMLPPSSHGIAACYPPRFGASSQMSGCSPCRSWPIIVRCDLYVVKVVAAVAVAVEPVPPGKQTWDEDDKQTADPTSSSTSICTACAVFGVVQLSECDLVNCIDTGEGGLDETGTTDGVDGCDAITDEGWAEYLEQITEVWARLPSAEGVWTTQPP